MAHTNTTRRRDSDSARERAAALRATQLRRERRRRIVIITSSVVAVLAVVAVIIVIGSSSKSGSTNSSASRTDASTSVVNAVTGVSGATLDSIGAGSATPPAAVKDAALASSGKPKVLYVGAEFCPYCAASRWALVQALSRFGTFSGLQITASASNDAFPNTSTFTFHGATYDSATISFVGRELQDRNRAELDTISSADAALWHRYTGQGSYPFLDIAGKYVEIGKTVDPALLGNLTADQIAQRLDTPSDPIAKAIDGQANVLTAAICQATNNAPAAVCTAPAVTVAAKALHG